MSTLDMTIGYRHNFTDTNNTCSRYIKKCFVLNTCVLSLIKKKKSSSIFFTSGDGELPGSENLLMRE